MFLLIYFGKNFGLSNNLRTMCAIGGAGKATTFFDFDWRSQTWNLVFVLGAIIGGFITANFLMNDQQIALSQNTIVKLEQLGFENPGEQYLPAEIFSPEQLNTVGGMAIFIIAGFLVGFGARYAGGCTSGHAISGLSDLQVPSLIAVVGFFIGGLIMTHLIFPVIF